MAQTEGQQAATVARAASSGGSGVAVAVDLAALVIIDQCLRVSFSVGV